MREEGRKEERGKFPVPILAAKCIGVLFWGSVKLTFAPWAIRKGSTPFFSPLPLTLYCAVCREQKSLESRSARDKDSEGEEEGETYLHRSVVFYRHCPQH